VKADALEKRTAAAKALNAAKLQVEEAEEESAKAVEQPFKFYGSNLSQSEQSSWDKIFTKLTIDAPHTDIFGKQTFYDCMQIHLQSRFFFNAQSCRSSAFSTVSRSLQR
jgi:hypothetical protein